MNYTKENLKTILNNFIDALDIDEVEEVIYEVMFDHADEDEKRFIESLLAEQDSDDDGDDD